MITSVFHPFIYFSALGRFTLVPINYIHLQNNICHIWFSFVLFILLTQAFEIVTFFKVARGIFWFSFIFSSFYILSARAFERGHFFGVYESGKWLKERLHDLMYVVNLETHISPILFLKIFSIWIYLKWFLSKKRQQHLRFFLL
jgi:hypothetical protein